ncbi:MAG: SRPBCC family protein [Acidimicrobiales bacterium]
MNPSSSPQQLAPPDLSDRSHGFTVERDMTATPAEIFRAWTEQFDSWFATPGVIRMRAVVEDPFFFETVYEGARHPHYGRFLTPEPTKLVELTWMTGKDGTDGAETVVRVELEEARDGSHLRLTHAGFYDAKAADRHSEAWPHVLDHLDQRVVEMR